jgi:hypothetical protein
MRTLAALALALPLFAQDAREIVRISLEREANSDKIARQYTFLQRVEQRELDADGKMARRRVKTYDVTLLEGSPYSRLVAREDKPLAPAEEAREKEKLERSIRERSREPEAARIRRIAKWNEERDKDRRQFRKILDAFDFRIVAGDAVAGESTWLIEATPRPGFRPHSRMTSIFPKMRGRIWISKTNYGWARMEAETLDTITFGAFLARLHKGMRLSMEQEHVNNEVWLPKHICVEYSARVLLLKSTRGEAEITFSGFRKFQANSRIVNISEPVNSRPSRTGAQ